MFSRHNLSFRFYVSFAQSVFLIMHIYEQYIWFNHIFTIISSNCLVFLRYRCRLYIIMHGRQRSKKGGETCGNTGNGLTSFPVFSLFSRIFRNPVTFWLPQLGTVYLSQATSKPLWKEWKAMRKNVIYAIHPDSDAVLYLDFYYRSVGDGQYLFSCPYRRCLHLYFADGKSFRELREHRDWLKNRKLTIFVEGRLKKTLQRLYPQER